MKQYNRIISAKYRNIRFQYLNKLIIIVLSTGLTRLSLQNSRTFNYSLHINDENIYMNEILSGISDICNLYETVQNELFI